MASERGYFIDIHHPGLGLFKRVKGPNPYAVQQMAQATWRQWEARWSRAQEVERTRAEAARARLAREHSRATQGAREESLRREAEEATKAAQATFEQLEGLLRHTLAVNDRVDFESLKNPTPFQEAPLPQPAYLAAPPQPVLTYRQHVPAAAYPFGSPQGYAATQTWQAQSAHDQRQAALRAEDEAHHRATMAAWYRQTAAVHEENSRRYAHCQAQWQDYERRRAAYEARRAAVNASIDETRRQYMRAEPAAVEQYCDHVLSNSVYPDFFPKKAALEYAPDRRLLVVEYALPSPGDLPTMKSVRYVKTTGQLAETKLKEAEAKHLYESVVHQVVLRTLHELFEADAAGALDSIALNAVVEGVDAATGRPTQTCLLSVRVAKSVFLAINLASVDPKICLQKLRAVGSAEPTKLAGVAPVVALSGDDGRYIEGRAVLSKIEASTNLATLDWQDFEHLVRDLFAREFAEKHGTRACIDLGGA